MKRLLRRVQVRLALRRFDQDQEFMAEFFRDLPRDPDAMAAWVERKNADLFTERIANMKAWEKWIRRWTALTVLMVLFQAVIWTWVMGALSILNVVAAGFIMTMHTFSVRNFAVARAGLLTDLEESPDHDPSEYDAYDPKGRRG